MPPLPTLASGRVVASQGPQWQSQAVRGLQAQANWLFQQRSLLLIQLILIKHLLCTKQGARCCGGGGR